MHMRWQVATVKTWCTAETGMMWTSSVSGMPQGIPSPLSSSTAAHAPLAPLLAGGYSYDGSDTIFGGNGDDEGLFGAFSTLHSTRPPPPVALLS